MTSNAITSKTTKVTFISTVARVKINGLEYWVMRGNSGYAHGSPRICRAYPFDTQEDMHATMEREGRELTAEERDAFTKAF